MTRLLAALLMVAASAFSNATLAQSGTYPAKPVRLIVPSPPGDGSDLMARAIGERLSQALGQPVVVDNRPGAGGRVGTEAFAAIVKSDIAKWKEGARTANITAD